MRYAGLPLVALAACGPVDPEVAYRQCEERAREAAGPTGRVTIGANSEDGPFASVRIGITSDALAGRDPLEVFETCVIERTGARPTRLPELN